MKHLLVVLLLAMPLLSFAQKTKTVKIAPMGYLDVTGEILYQADEKTPKDTLYTMEGIDNQFNYGQHYSQYKRIPISSGSLQKMYNTVQSALNTIHTEEVGVNVTKYDVKMSVRQPALIKELTLHSSNPADNGFTVLTANNIKEILERIEAYADKNKVVLKKWN